MKILTVVGARPQFIKAAVVSHVIADCAQVQEIMVHTGQHFDANMSDVFFRELGIPEPKHSLGVHSLAHGAMTGRMLEGIEDILIREEPDWLLVYGDTNSTLAGALAAVKLHIPVAHVEAGLRSFNRKMPEEINRIATDHISERLFAPTRTAVEHLKSEGITEPNVVLAGDVMYDCAIKFGEIARANSKILESLKLKENSFILCTAHRAETTDSITSMTSLMDAVASIASEIPVVIPMHPRTRNKLGQAGTDLSNHPGVHVIDPVGYLDMVRLEQSAALILTDSGGVQKEAYFHQVPCVTMRKETEWVELVASGWNTLCPLEAGASKIQSAVRNALGTQGQATRLYGDGNAAQHIVANLLAQN